MSPFLLNRPYQLYIYGDYLYYLSSGLSENSYFCLETKHIVNEYDIDPVLVLGEPGDQELTADRVGGFAVHA